MYLYMLFWFNQSVNFAVLTDAIHTVPIDFFDSCGLAVYIKCHVNTAC